MAAYVYLLEAENGRVKIGYSTYPEGRAAAAATLSPLRVRLIAKFEDTPEGERILHTRFTHCRVHREWFEPDERMKNYIDNQLRGVGVSGIPEWDELTRAGEAERRAEAGRKRSKTLRQRYSDNPPTSPAPQPQDVAQ